MDTTDAERQRLLSQFGMGKTTKEDGPVRDEPVESDSALDSDGESYAAFKTFTRRRISLLVCAASEPWQWLKYGYLLHVQADSAGTRLDLVFSFLIVTVTGRNLLPVADAIANETCGKIVEFNARQWAKPMDSSASFIESVVYLTNQPSAEEREAA